MRTKRLLLLVGTALLALLGCGYAVALLERSACEGKMRSEVLAKNVTGRNMLGEVIPSSQIDVYSRVEYPFIVVAGYFVPVDLEGSYHEAWFLVLPGYVHEWSSTHFDVM